VKQTTILLMLITFESVP